MTVVHCAVYSECPRSVPVQEIVEVARQECVASVDRFIHSQITIFHFQCRIFHVFLQLCYCGAGQCKEYVPSDENADVLVDCLFVCC